MHLVPLLTESGLVPTVHENLCHVNSSAIFSCQKYCENDEKTYASFISCYICIWLTNHIISYTSQCSFHK